MQCFGEVKKKEGIFLGVEKIIAVVLMFQDSLKHPTEALLAHSADA